MGKGGSATVVFPTIGVAFKDWDAQLLLLLLLAAAAYHSIVCRIVVAAMGLSYQQMRDGMMVCWMHAR